MKIKAAIVYEPHGPYVVDEVDLDGPKAGEVLVKIVASGYCHTDHSTAHREERSLHPVILGHEGSGIVVEVGEGVKDFKPGDRVCMSFAYCGECFACTTGRPYQCAKVGPLNFGGKAFDGTNRLWKDGKALANFFNQSSFATYSVTHQYNLVHVPDEIDLRLAGPLGCGIQTGAGAVLNALKPGAGSSFIVMGLGGVGMSGLLAAKASGCTTVIGVDMVDSRLDAALELGATHVINAKEDNVPAIAREITKGFGTDFALDATGTGAAANTALRCTNDFGALAIIGGGGEFNAGGLGARTITGITEGRSVPTIFIPLLMRLYLQGLFPFDKMIRFYDFEDINTAAEDSASGKTIKPVLVMPT